MENDGSNTRRGPNIIIQIKTKQRSKITATCSVQSWIVCENGGSNRYSIIFPIFAHELHIEPLRLHKLKCLKSDFRPLPLQKQKEFDLAKGNKQRGLALRKELSNSFFYKYFFFN